MLKLNFYQTLQKCKEILETWKKRKLTTIGKICVVNVLVTSLFSQKLAILPMPPQQFFDEYRQMVTKFIWDDKVPKIRYSKIIQGYTEGGLKLIDLKSKALALKANWPFCHSKLLNFEMYNRRVLLYSLGNPVEYFWSFTKE